MREGEDVDKFWSETESRIGEHVLVYSLGQYVGGYGEVRSGTWGLFFVSESALHFQTFHSENWFSSIVRGRKRGQPTETEMEFQLPLTSLREVTVTRQESWFRRIFAPEPPMILAAYSLPTGKVGELQFSMDLKLREFVETLKSQMLRSE
ncbi:MAG TPA: hypothetical protein VMW69_15110 [Spirochaetia bacterium]|nr:hypothetical protein [Spirochaetia bacterium]